MVLGESANALTSFTSARFSFSYWGGHDGRRCNSSVQRIDSSGTGLVGIEMSVCTAGLRSGRVGAIFATLGCGPPAAMSIVLSYRSEPHARNATSAGRWAQAWVSPHFGPLADFSPV